jgi:serine/threonine protein phosphatase PrpC
MNCDSYFEIGSSHMVCQDYALSGNYKDMWYGIVSDGCSSAEFSEIGAQVLCHVTKNILMVYYDLFLNGSVTPEFIAQLLATSIRVKADEVRKIYPISRDSLQATLLIAVVINGFMFTFVWGDGVIILGWDKNITVTEIDYPDTNAPVYLMTDIESYKRKFEDKLTKRVCIYNHREYATNKNIVSRPFEEPIVDCRKTGPGDFILLCTDGLTQYQDQNKKPIDIHEILPLILDYPNFNGQFVKRTMNFLKRDLARKNWSHADDVGIVTLINI